MITASVVTYHTSHEDISHLLNSIDNSSISKVFIIDHSSNENLKNYVKTWKKVEYIKHENKGYGAGHNVGLRRAEEVGAKYHVVINPDVYWDDDVIEKLRNFMDSTSECGVVIPKNCNPDGSLRYICRLLPSPYDLILRRFNPLKKFNEKHDYRYQMKWTGYDKIMEVPVISGCFMFFRMAIISQLSGFDERFFMYMEDIDLSRRCGNISKVMYYPETNIYHKADRGSYKNVKLLKYHLNAAIKYFNKWGWFIDRTRSNVNKRILNHEKL